MGDIDPAHYSGEGFYNADEVPRPDDVLEPYARGQAKDLGDYYPKPDFKRRKKR